MKCGKLLPCLIIVSLALSGCSSVFVASHFRIAADKESPDIKQLIEETFSLVASEFGGSCEDSRLDRETGDFSLSCDFIQNINLSNISAYRSNVTSKLTITVRSETGSYFAISDDQLSSYVSGDHLIVERMIVENVGAEVIESAVRRYDGRDQRDYILK